MRLGLLSVAALAGVALAAPQGVTDNLAPSGSPPAGCSMSADGTWEVTIVQLAKRDDVQKRSSCAGEGILVMTLKDGVLKDAQGRVGYIASNFQFQFDGPPQAGAIYTGGFSACSNGSLALAGSTTFYQCLSGNFYNLYDRHWAAQCEPIHMNLMACGGGGYVGGQQPDGQVVGTTMVATTIVTVLSDGQPQVVPTSVPIPMCQIGDGQVQAHTTPCASIPLPTMTAPPVSQISDGQIQVPQPSTKPPASPAPPASNPAPPPATLPAPTTAAPPAPSVSVPVGVTSTRSVPAVVPTTAANPSAPVNDARQAGPSPLMALAAVVVGTVWYLL